MADRFGSDQVERALAMQEGSVLANEVLRLREENERWLIVNGDLSNRTVAAEVEVERLEREQVRLRQLAQQACRSYESFRDHPRWQAAQARVTAPLARNEKATDALLRRTDALREMYEIECLFQGSSPEESVST